MKRTVNLLLAASLAGCVSVSELQGLHEPIPQEDRSVTEASEFTLKREAAYAAEEGAGAKYDAADAASVKAYDKCMAARKAAAGRKAFAAYVDDTCEAALKAVDYSLKLYDEYKSTREAAVAAKAREEESLLAKEAADAERAAAERAAVAEWYLAQQAAAAERAAVIRDAALIYAVSRPVYVPPPVIVQPPIRCMWNQYGGSCY